MQLILSSSTGTLVTVAVSTAPDGGFHRESMCSQAKPAHIPHDMLRDLDCEALMVEATCLHLLPCASQPSDLKHNVGHQETVCPSNLSS